LNSDVFVVNLLGIVKRMIALDPSLKIKLNGKEIEHSYFD